MRPPARSPAAAGDDDGEGGGGGSDGGPLRPLWRADDGAPRVATPRLARCAFTSAIPTLEWWKIEAASAASHPVASKTSEKWAGAPAPLDAITGILTAPFTEATSPRSKPLFWPSLSMQLRRISPQPSASTAWHTWTTSRPDPFRPPCTVHSYQHRLSPLGPRTPRSPPTASAWLTTLWPSASAAVRTHTRRGSIETTTACRPYTCEIASIDDEPSALPLARYLRATSTASEPIDTLSAPARKYASAT